MGMANARMLPSGQELNCKTSWHDLQCGIRYSKQDVRLWPQFEPLAQWFTAQDARRLNLRLHRKAGATGLLTLKEFLQWINEDDKRSDSHVDKVSDVITPKVSANHHQDLDDAKVNARDSPSLQEKYFQHVFFTLTDERGDRLYALEFLAALVVVSRAIWDVHEKMTLLLELFHDPATSSSKPTTYVSSQRLKETDIARLLLCVVNGVGRVTQGVSRVWHTHGLRVASIARQNASHCIQSIVSMRVAASGIKLDLLSSKSVSSEEFRAYVASTPALHQFLALFAGEELRNPLTFKPSAPHFTKQTELYETLLRRYVTFEGRSERRRYSAALLIQSTWRRRRSLSDAKQRVQERVIERHKSAAQLQEFFKRRRVARQLETRAEVEREALNGGVFVAGSGASIGLTLADFHQEKRRSVNTGVPIRLIGAFVNLNAKLTTLAASSTFALGIEDDGHSIIAWGRCLPRLYEGVDKEEKVCLTHLTPRRLQVRLPTRVIQASCGLRHALVLTEDGMVFSWGFNAHGQLGHNLAETIAVHTSGRVRYDSYYNERSGEDENYLASPTKLLYFDCSSAQQADPIPIVQVCCGDYYSMALSQTGAVFTWGEASEGQLGHGETYEFYQVALADRHIVSSAYTYLAQPKPVLTLSDVRVTQIACHSVALSADDRTSKLFEWGNWGRRRGVDSEHAFVPEEMTEASALRLRQVAVGDHHILAEGASVWLKLVTCTDGPVQAVGYTEEETGFYVEPLAGVSRSFDAIEHDFMTEDISSWVCCLVDLDVDDVDEDENINSATDEQPSRPSTADVETDMRSLWQRRAARCAVTLDRLSEFDPRTLQLLGSSTGSANAAVKTYAQGVDQCLRGRVANRLVVMPRGKPAGFYVQFRLSLNTFNNALDTNSGDSRTEETRDEDNDPGSAAASGVVLELAVCGSNTAKHVVGRRGVATHVYHPAMETAAKRLKQQQLRMEKPTVAPTEMNSMFVLEIDQSVLTPVASTVTENEALGVESEAKFEAETIISEIVHRVLELQEAGALVVLVILDLFEAEAFTLHFSEDSGVFIPVFMTTRQVQALVVGSFSDEGVVSEPEESDSSRRLSWTVQEVLEYMVTSPTTFTPPQPSMSLPHRPSIKPKVPSLALHHPPPLMTRCFYRTDTAPTRARGAFANGAATVLFVANEASSDPSQTVLRRSLAAALPSHTSTRHQLVGLIPYEHGQRLRSVCRLTSLENSSALSLSVLQSWSLSGASSIISTAAYCELVADMQFELRHGGTTYAWGDADSGRLGLGEVSASTTEGESLVDETEFGSPLFQDGYEAFTNATYSFVAQPTAIPTLAGVEMKQLSCGSAHSLAVTKNGKVFSWGRGEQGQLGHPVKSSRSFSTAASTDEWTPRVVHGLQYERVTQVVATDQSSLFLSELMPAALYEQRRRQLAQLRAISKPTGSKGKRTG